jgi:hypothetical protein
MRFYPRGTNLGVRRELALAVGGFPVTRYGEDLEFSHRLRERGAGVRFAPDAVVLHNETRTPPQVFWESFQKGKTRVRLARRCRMHQLLHAAPAGLVLYLALVPVAAALWPGWAALWGGPGLAYLALLAVLAVQGVWALGEARAAAVVPLYALGMHLGYGLGYLAALVAPGRDDAGDAPGAGNDPGQGEPAGQRNGFAAAPGSASHDAGAPVGPGVPLPLPQPDR